MISKFPVLEVGAISNTSATMKSHYLFYLRGKRLEVEYVKCKWLYLIVAVRTQASLIAKLWAYGLKVSCIRSRSDF